MKRSNTIDYVEFPSKNIPATKAFFTAVFGWQFEDFGPNYTAFTDNKTKGGFYTSQKTSSTNAGSPLIVLYSKDLEATQNQIESAGGLVVQPIFSFPGGSRFHFQEPGGNELAVWTETHH